MSSRFTPDPRRDRVWLHIARYLSRWWNEDAAIADIGAGYCSFINAVSAARRVAVDIHEDLSRHAAADVECVHASATDLHDLTDASFDVVFASNLLEHLSREDIVVALAEFKRVLKPGGRLILVQPNYRLKPGEYFDDYTHLTPLSDRSLGDLLAVSGFEILEFRPRFLPFTIKSRAGRFTFLVPIYIRSPLKPFAGQMLAVARRPLPDQDIANGRAGEPTG